jgi:hypothetical protein
MKWTTLVFTVIAQTIATLSVAAYFVVTASSQEAKAEPIQRPTVNPANVVHHVQVKVGGILHDVVTIKIDNTGALADRFCTLTTPVSTPGTTTVSCY